jgi:hypothetical protein
MEALILAFVEGIAKLGGAGWIFSGLLLLAFGWLGKRLLDEYERGRKDTARMTEVVTLATSAMEKAISVQEEATQNVKESATVVEGLAKTVELMRSELWQEVRSRRGT